MSASASLLAVTLLAGAPALAAEGEGARAEDPAETETLERAYAAADAATWREVLKDDGAGDWTDLWFLDGDKARVINSPEGMILAAGPTPDDDACHAVLWTQASFEGDVKLEFDYTRLDRSDRGVNLIYLLATGTGEPGFAKDIAAWSEHRRVPGMGKYFGNMHLYAVSYSTTNPETDYIRARRYLPEGKTLRGTEIPPVHGNTNLFQFGVTSRVRILKHGDWLLFEITHPELGRQRYGWKTSDFPPVTEGRIGLRQMFTRISRYANIRISQRDE